MRSTHRKPADSSANSRAQKRGLPRPSSKWVRRQADAALVQAAQQAAAWAAEQRLPALTGRSWEVQAGELVRATLADDVERWKWTLAHNFLILTTERPEHALSALRDIAAADRAAAEVMAERDVAVWRQMAEEVPGQSIRDVLARRWRELREQSAEDDAMVLVRYLQHPDPGIRELAIRATSGSTAA